MVRIKREHAERGAHAEGEFRAWLDASRLPYVYATQDKESVPQHFRASMKRPDYLVALPFVATLAFDVKSKTAYEGSFLFDVSEVRRLCQSARNIAPGSASNIDPLVVDTDGSARVAAAGRGCGGGARAGSLA